MSNPSSPTEVATRTLASPRRKASICATCSFCVIPFRSPVFDCPTKGMGDRCSLLDKRSTRRSTVSRYSVKTSVFVSVLSRCRCSSKRSTACGFGCNSSTCSRLSRNRRTAGRSSRRLTFLRSFPSFAAWRSRNALATSMPWQRSRSSNMCRRRRSETAFAAS